MLVINLPNGEKRNIRISLFKALDGWEIQNRFVDFAISSDKAFRRDFTIEILSYANVALEGRELPLTTDALIDNHLQTWKNVQSVFEEVLCINGIDPKTHAEKPNYWDNAGAALAVSFIAQSAKLLGPAMGTYNEVLKASNV